MDQGDRLGLLHALARGATRRDVMTMLLAAGMQAGAATSLAALAVSAHAQTPRRGGRIRVAGATSSTGETLDPAKQSNQMDYARGHMLYNGLTALDGSLTPQPALAESFATQDAKTWVFTLRKGVEFHDGKALTPEDVVYSLARHKHAATGSKVKGLADQFEAVRVSGPREVTLELAMPNVDLPAILGTYHFHVVKAGTTDFSKGVGTGPFKLKEFTAGGRSVVVRNERYWKPGQPYLDEIEFEGMPDERARINALLYRDYDLVSSIDPRSVSRVMNTRGYAIATTPASNYTNLVMRRDMGPGSSPDFVMAMKLLMNRELMKKAVALDHAVVANDQPIGPGNRFHFGELAQRPFDPEKARYHLKKSGVTGTVSVVASRAATYSVDMAVMLQQFGQSIGLALEVQQVPADGYWSQHWLQNAVGFGNVNARPTADAILTQFFKSDAAWNESRWKSPRFDQLLLAARGELDILKRQQMYADMQVLIHQEAGIGIPLFLSSVDGHTSRLKGLQPIPLGGLMGNSFAEHVWLDT
jgi:peptide/nickel transport system substrate-binding protein